MELQSEINNILDTKNSLGRTVKEMTGPEFCRFCILNLSDVRADDYEIIRLTKFLNTWTQDTMSDESKIDVINRLRNKNLM